MKVIPALQLLTFAVACVVSIACFADRKSEAEQIITQFGSELKVRLSTGLKTGGPVDAISVCTLQAPIIASRLSRLNGAKVQRVSARFRNPLNKPAPWQREILEFLEHNPYASNSVYMPASDGKTRYASGIKMDGLCLSCHGSSIATEVSDELAESYPFDLATGYQLNELRGIFSVEWETLADKQGIKHLKMLSEKLWVGGQPSGSQISELKARGITTIINLRMPHEMTFDEAAVTTGLGMHYVNLPINGEQHISRANSARLRSELDKSTGAVFVHDSNSDRAGALLALDAAQSGLDRDSAIRVGKMAGLASLLLAVEAEIDSALASQ